MGVSGRWERIVDGSEWYMGESGRWEGVVGGKRVVRDHPFSTYAKFRQFLTHSRPPRMQNDVTVTNKLIVLRTLLDNPPLPPYVRTY